MRCRSSPARYKHGWNTEIEMDYAPKGVNQDIVRLISARERRAGVDDRLAAGGLPALGGAWTSRTGRC